MSAPSAIRRDVGPFALMFIGLGSMIGSGWLFGAWRAAGVAGPGAVWAWVIGALIITTIALSPGSRRFIMIVSSPAEPVPEIGNV